MAVDVIIDPSSGQIYWNDAAGSGTQTIAISGNATNAINIVGYSNFFSPGGGGVGTNILATFNDSATSTFVPGTNAYDLGSSSLRWNFYGTAGNFTGVISTSSSTASIGYSSGALTVTGGVGIGGSLYVNDESSFRQTSTTKSALKVSGANRDNNGIFEVTSVDGGSFKILNNVATSYGVLMSLTPSSNSAPYVFGINKADTSNAVLVDVSNMIFTMNRGMALRVYDSTANFYFGLKYTGSGNTTYTWPSFDGTAGQVLYTNGSAALGWTTPSGSAAGSSTQVQYNQGGAFGATSSLTYVPSTGILSAPFLTSTNSAANEGGEIVLNYPSSGTALTTTITIDIYQNKLRFFETGGANRGAYIDFTACLNSVGTNLLVGSGASGLTSLNGLTASTQTFAVGTSGTDFNISSATSTHTFNIPYAGAASTGLITTQTQTIAGAKTFSGNTSVTSSTAATTTSTGALTISGGVGIGGSLWTSTSNFSSISGVGFNNSTITSGTWSGNAITLVYGGTNNTISGVGHSYRVAIYDATGTAITNISSAGTANSVLFQASQSTSPNWAGQSQLVVGGASTAANIQGGALGNIHYQTGANATGFVSNAAGSGASILTQTGNAAPIFLGQSQLLVGSASTSAQVVTDASTATRYLLGTTANTASSAASVSTGSGITIGNNLLTTGGLAVTSSTASTSTATGTLVVTGGVGIGGSLWTSTSNLASVSGVTLNNGTITGTLSGTATSAQVIATTTDTSSTLYLLGSRSSTGFAGTAVYVDTNISILGSQITAGVWAGTAISAVNGGTGQVSYTIGDLLYASSTTALSKLSSGTAGSVLTSNGAGAAPAWKAATGSGGSPAGSTSQLQYNNAGSFGATSGLTFNKNSNSEFIVSTPYLVGTQGVINIGPDPFDGVSLGQFSGNSNGTQIAVNAATGFVGNFVDYQIHGSSKFTIGSDGKITVVGVYSLPTTAGTAGSVLTSNGTGGQFYWSAPSTGGGGAGTVASGTANQVAYYPATGASVTGAANLTYNTTSVIVANTTASNNNSSGALLVFGGIGASGQISGAGASFTSTVFLTSIRIGQNGNNITFTDASGATIGDFNTSNGWLRSAQVTQSTSTSTGALVSSGGLGVAKAASIGETIYGYSTVASTGWSTGSLISSGGLGVSKASYFNGDLFVTSGTNSTSLATGALVISGGVGIGKTMYVGDNINIFKSGSVGALRFWNSANTFYTGLQAGNPSANTTYTLPTAYPGSGTSVLTSDTAGTLTWGAPGGTGTVTTITSGLGISFSTGTTITTTGTVRLRRPVTLIFCAGYTPAATGADSVVLKVPDNQNTGASDRIFNCIEAAVRVETASGTATTIRIEKYAYAGGTGVSAFSTSSTGSTINILSGVGLTLSGATTFEFSTSSFAAGHGTCASGDKLRLNFTQLSATHANFSIRLVLEEQ